jgi:sugar lactone lactonase YvrE
MKLRFFFTCVLLSGSAAAHMTVDTTGAGVIYNADLEGFSTGTPLPADGSGASSDRPRSIDSNLTATIEDAGSVPSDTPTLNSKKFVRLRESCGEAPSLAFDRGISLGTAASPNAIAHVAVDLLFENIESYQIVFRNGSGSGIPGAASQTIADIDFVPGPVLNIGNAHFSSRGGTTSIGYSAGVPIHLDAFFDMGNNKWYAFVNGGRIVNGAAILDTAVHRDTGEILPVPLGFVGIGFNFSSACPPSTGASFTGVMQFDNFVFQQVSAIPDVTPPAATPTLSNVLTGVGRPYGTAIHGGFAYIADPQAHTVWKVGLANPGQKTPVAGIGWKTDLDPQDWQGYNGDGIESTEAQLDNPSGVAVDADGNLYIADTGNHAVRKIAAGASFITTVAGIPTSFAVGENTRLFSPRSVAVDQAGNVYIADMMNQQVKRLDKTTGATSVVSGVAGRPGANNGPVVGAEFCPPFEPAGCTAAARLNSPIGVAVDSEGIVYIADEGNNRTRKVTLGGNVSTLLASGLLKPTAIAVTPDGGTAYIADYGNHRVLRAECNSDGCSVTTIAGTGTPGSAANPGPATAVQLNSPMGVTLDGNFLYIADMMNGRVVVIDLTPVP